MNAKPATNMLLLHGERIYDYRRFIARSISPWTIHRQQWLVAKQRKNQPLPFSKKEIPPENISAQ